MPEEAAAKKGTGAGLRGQSAGQTAVCTVGAEGNSLRYRGFDVVELAQQSTFFEVAYLILKGQLPTQVELDTWKTMSVPADGSYGIEPGIIYSYPCVCENGDYRIVQGLDIDEFSRERMDATEAELREERSAVEDLL